MVHIPVMATEAIGMLNVTPQSWYIDATLGGGGHAQRIMSQGGKVIGLDVDPEAINHVRQRLADQNLHLFNLNFTDMQVAVTTLGLQNVQGILFDLGTSAIQLNDPSRGFSFLYDSPLDMRMTPDLTVTAADLVNGLSKKELYALFRELAQEKHARSLADHIIRARRIKPITTTGQLVSICEAVYGNDRGKINPATKAFQALRIAVNDERNALTTALVSTITLLNQGGRLVVISFHEGEDRLVKYFLRNNMDQFKILTPKPLVPTPEEIKLNPRAHSAKLRVAEKL